MIKTKKEPEYQGVNPEVQVIDTGEDVYLYDTENVAS